MKASKPSARFATCLARPIPPKRRRDRSGANLVRNIMINAAHASDSAENAARELGIINVAENNFRTVVEEFYGKS